MKIGIIGAGNIGTLLARKLSASGHQIKLANSKGPDSIRKLASSIGAEAVTKEDAVKEVDVIVLSVPFAIFPELKTLFSAVPDKVVVVDTSNYYPARDGVISEVDGGKPESIWVSEQLGRPVVKAWNAAVAETLANKGQPSGSASRIALPVAGDSPDAEKIVRDLVEETGFDAFASGSLIESKRQQPGTPAYCTELTLPELKAALLAAQTERAPANRDALMAELMSATAPLTHEHIIARNRAITAG